MKYVINKHLIIISRYSVIEDYVTNGDSYTHEWVDIVITFARIQIIEF